MTLRILSKIIPMDSLGCFEKYSFMALHNTPYL